MSFEWKGIFPALLTPFTMDDELDIPMFEKNLQAQLEAGVHGIITVSYTHLRAHETVLDLVCRLLLEKKKY